MTTDDDGALLVTPAGTGPLDFSWLLLHREKRGEILINRVRGTVSVLSILAGLLVDSSNTPAARVVFVTIALVWLAYSCAIWWLIHRAPEQPRPWLKHMSTVFDVGIIGSAYFGTLVNYAGALEYWNGGTLQVFALWNLLPALRLAPTACWTAGVATLVVNGALLAYTVLTHAVPLAPVSSWGSAAIHVPDVVLAIVITSLPAFAAGWIARMARRLLMTGARASAERQRIATEQELLRKFLPQDVMEIVTQNRTGAHLNGENRVVSVVFVDIRGFTRFSDGQPPARTVAVLNQFFEEMVAVVTDCGGTLDKFLGDGFLAVFGAPHPLGEAPVRAVLAGARMLQQMKVFVAALPVDLPPIDIGVAVATGEVLIGTVGTQERMEFTCMGPTVNRASRLENLNKHYKTRLLMDAETRAAVASIFTVQVIDQVQLRGIEDSVEVSTVSENALDEALVKAARRRLSRVVTDGASRSAAVSL